MCFTECCSDEGGGVEHLERVRLVVGRRLGRRRRRRRARRRREERVLVAAGVEERAASCIVKKTAAGLRHATESDAHVQEPLLDPG